MPIPTPNMNLQKPTVGGDSGLWGILLNANMDTIDTLAVLPFSTPSVNGNSAYDTSRTTVFELVTGGSSGVTRTLPSAVGHGGKAFFFKKVDSGLGFVSIATTASQTIDSFVAPFVLFNQNQYVVVMSDGANWQIIGNN